MAFKHIVSAMFLIFYPTFALSSEAFLHKSVQEAAKKVGCSKADFKLSDEGKLLGQTSNTLVFFCREFSPKKPGIEKGAIVVSGKDNQCPELIVSEPVAELHILDPKHFIGPINYDEFFIHEKNGHRLYSGPSAKERVPGNVIEVCHFQGCSVVSVFVCKDKQWLVKHAE